MAGELPAAREDPVAEGITRLSARFTQNNATAGREMLLPERFQKFPLAPFVEDIGSDNLIKRSLEAILLPIEPANIDARPPVQRVEQGKEQ